MIGVSIVFAWALLGANSARLAEAHWKKALAVEQRLSARDWQGSDEEYIDLIRHARSAADYEPGNVKYRHWLNVYRWESISRITDPNTGELVIPEQSMEFVRRIVDELNSARVLCPTYGVTHCVAGQLERFRSYDRALETYLELLENEPMHLKALERVAELYARRGEFDKALEYTRKVLKVDTYAPGTNFIYGTLQKTKGNLTDAKDGFRWAMRSLEYHSASLQQLSEISLIHRH